MSGIFGIVHRDGKPVEPSSLERMRDEMGHRGPDGSEIVVDGNAGFGQLMLCSTPESLNERLPWKDTESGLVITADARIDNRAELLTHFGAEAVPVISRHHGPAVPDSLLILEAFKCWGEDCVDHLLGDFAFAIWSPREMKLFFARDHMGIRPFYYFQDDRQFVFASSALGVVAADGVPNRISDTRIADYLVPELEGADKTRSWFRDVRRMPPARAGTLSAAGISTREYWRPDTEKEATLSSDEEYTDAFEEVLKVAVKARMRSHKPVSSMLSGGVDSSTIVALARNIQAGTGGGPFATFSGVSEPGEDCRESRFCRRVIEQGGLEATLILPSQVVEFEDRLREIDRVTEDPFDLAWIHHRMIYLSARERGHVAVMDGIDGDGVASLTTAYPAYLLRDGQLLTAHRELIGKWSHYHRRTISLWKTYTDPLRLALVPEFLRKMKQSVFNRQPSWLEQSAPISSEFAASTQVAARQADFRKRVDLGRLDTLRQAHAKRITVPYLTAGIERYGRIAAACGVEQRQPFLDRRVIEHCLSLPWQQKSRNGWSKFGLRRVAERVLPPEVAWRTGWDSILWKFRSARDALNREQIIEVASQDHEVKNRIFLAKNFDQLLDEYKIGSVDVADSVSNYASLFHWMRNNGEPGE